MENATKVLIIAGAILVSIIVISLGVMIVNGSNDTINESISQMDQTRKDMFNQKFQNYAGSAVSGTNVKALINLIISNNNANYENAGKILKINFTGAQATARLNKSTDATTKNAITTVKLEKLKNNGIDTLDDTQIKDFAKAAAALANVINTGTKYEVIMPTDPKTGLVYEVTINEDKVAATGNN